MRGGVDRRALARDPRTRVGVARVKRANLAVIVSAKLPEQRRA